MSRYPLKQGDIDMVTSCLISGSGFVSYLVKKQGRWLVVGASPVSPDVD